MEIDLRNKETLTKADSYLGSMRSGEIVAFVMTANIYSRTNDKGVRIYYSEDLNSILRRFNKFQESRLFEVISIETMTNRTEVANCLHINGIRFYCKRVNYKLSPR